MAPPAIASKPDLHARLFAELLDVARGLGLEVRVEGFRQALSPGGPAAGGLCQLRGRKILLLDENAPSYERAHTLAQVLGAYEHLPLKLGGPAWRLVRRARLAKPAVLVPIPIKELLVPPIPRRRGKPGIRTCASGITPVSAKRSAPARRPGDDPRSPVGGATKLRTGGELPVTPPASPLPSRRSKRPAAPEVGTPRQAKREARSGNRPKLGDRKP